MADSQNLTPGTKFQRFLKQFWYLGIIGLIITVTGYIKDRFYKVSAIDVEKLEKRSHQVVVMTGGSTGIGFGIVKKLLLLDYTIILGVQTTAEGEKCVAEIHKLGITSGRMKLLTLELKSLDSVRQFAKEVLASEEGQRIDLLVNNGMILKNIVGQICKHKINVKHHNTSIFSTSAGIMIVPYEKTADNFESQFQVNYLSHFLLTNLLLDRMKDTAANKGEPCQIQYTTSAAQWGGKIDFDELEISKVYCPAKCYADSKLCLVIHTKTLQKRLQDKNINIHAYAVHPGEIPTEVWDNRGFIFRVSRLLLKPFFRKIDDAASIILYPALTPGMGEKWGGQYFENGRVTVPNRQADLPEIQMRLWEKSLELTQNTE
ncbi:Retinol dehydrogenase 12 [Orchesella cincta]|uniref:Retinol dehydrogenase 12 n=1 Tax=Orchesella cincta TaxID=48709 RepID=A0A1D2NM87_ORCCI|nr:Retinol dehydrogenase 12 [Orchesella cincta]